MPLNPQTTYVHLAANGEARELPGGLAFWSLPEDRMAALGKGWLISEYEFTADWATWEMHPNGDEFVYLLSEPCATTGFPRVRWRTDGRARTTYN